jgi:3-hydroxyacyl-CoA dehydrogenase
MKESVSTSPVKRRRRSSAEVAALLSAFEQSGQSMRDYCRQHQMPVSNFSGLLRRHAGEHSSARALPAAEPHASATTAFFPVKIVEDRRTAAVAVQSSALFVEMPGGIRIAVERDFDGFTLRRLVAALGRE